MMMKRTEDADQQLARRLALVLMAGAVVIWTGIAIEADSVQLVGVAVCLGAGAWLARVGWRRWLGR